mmetsp:Transcript_41824/g.104601  ORF Transcript_41824/g.104601 Transcript_41824/m.104601 type:complete len:252 (+) Transcript_41824:527-1282(+)
MWSTPSPAKNSSLSIAMGEFSCANTLMPSCPSSPTLLCPHVDRFPPSLDMAAQKLSPHVKKDVGGRSRMAFGSSRLWLSPCPSLPCSPKPQVQITPSLVTAPAWCAPAEMHVTLDSPLMWVATFRLALSPNPSAPAPIVIESPPYPHENTSPSSERAIPCRCPAATSLILTPSSPSTATGSARSSLPTAEVPNSPCSFDPIACTLPSHTKMVNFFPHATLETLPGVSTAVGTFALVASLSPSCPCFPHPVM